MTGFFSRFGAAALSGVAVDIVWREDVLKGALTKGCRGLRREKRRVGRGEEGERDEVCGRAVECRKKVQGGGKSQIVL